MTVDWTSPSSVTTSLINSAGEAAVWADALAKLQSFDTVNIPSTSTQATHQTSFTHNLLDLYVKSTDKLDSTAPYKSSNPLPPCHTPYTTLARQSLLPLTPTSQDSKPKGTETKMQRKENRRLQNMFVAAWLSSSR